VFTRRKRSAPEPDSPFERFLGLRSLAFGAYAGGLPTGGDDDPGVAAVVVDIPAEGGFVAVVVLADATTSLYTSVGGGTIGAGSHAPVAEASRALLAVVGSRIADFLPGEDPALPPRAVVRFHVFGRAGSFLADVPEDAFWGRFAHRLMPVISATQDVITAISSV
jgi:hypothetical protein